MESYLFDGILEKHDNHLYAFHIKVPEEIANSIRDAKINRLICTLNGGIEFRASLIPEGNDRYFIKVNGELRKKHRLEIGSAVNVLLKVDESKYGMDLPIEFEEILELDSEGDRYFHELTPGKQRSLLYIIGKPKSSDKRIEKGLIVMAHLKDQLGKLDFKKLNEDLKSKNKY